MYKRRHCKWPKQSHDNTPNRRVKMLTVYSITYAVLAISLAMVFQEIRLENFSFITFFAFQIEITQKLWRIGTLYTICLFRHRASVKSGICFSLKIFDIIYILFLSESSFPLQHCSIINVNIYTQIQMDLNVAIRVHCR